MTTEENEREWQQISQLEFCKKRPDTYLGSIELNTIPMYVLNLEAGKFILEDLKFPPGLLKIFDEILVNAIDHYINFPKLVTLISIEFDIETGYITIKNNGPGINIKKVETLHDGEVYKPQAIYSQFLGGDNFNDDKKKITGGKNGLGSKVTCAFSDIFKVETFDAGSRIIYNQTFKDQLSIIEEPIITKYTKKELDALELDKNDSNGYTEITFLPSYKAFGYKKYSKKVGETIYKLIELRTYQTTAFIQDCNIYFNRHSLAFEDNDIPKFKQFCNMFNNTEKELHYTLLEHPSDKRLHMEVCIGLSNGKMQSISLINGISVYKGGSHINYLKKEIVANIMPKVEAQLPKGHGKVSKTIIENNLFIYVKMSIIDPNFDSQSKVELTNQEETFTIYKFKDKGKKNDWEPIWEILKDNIMSNIIGKISDKTKSRVTRSKIMLKKGSDAKFAGNKTKWKQCLCFIAEGDSALSLVDEGINSKKTELQRDYCGTYSIQGVPINARKEVDTIEDKLNNITKCIRNEKLQNNVRFAELVKMLGLDYNKKYTIGTAEGDKEFETLRYGVVVVATDQDSDGKGQIFSLILNFFTLFWPDLIKRKYLTRFNTPVIRAYPKNGKGYVKEFYSLYGFDEWVQKEFGGDSEEAGKKYNIIYYKGLASNTNEEVVPMFTNFHDKLNVYEFDEDANKTLEVYFGKSTEPRKEVLCTPVDEKIIAECANSSNIKVSAHLNNDLKEYQRENIMRKIIHVIDGMVPSRRKTLFGARLNTKMSKEPIKVVNFTGFVMEHSGYHHGDASLAKTITKMAQNFVGAKNLPLLIGVGQFGTRKGGGNDHGSARYIRIKSNTKLINAIFPPQDDFLLPYVFDDGQRVEPEYYCPVIPMAILENTSIPATGWRIKVWARDINAVLKNVRNMINCKITKCKKLPIWLRGNNCDIRVGNDGKEYMVGKYEYNKKTNIVRITELPISVYNKSYIKSVANNKDGTYIKEIKNVEDYSNHDEETNVDEIDIQFELNPGALDQIKQKYEEALKSGKKIIRELVKESTDEKSGGKSRGDKSKDNVNKSDIEKDNDTNVSIDDTKDIDSIQTEENIDYKVDPLFDYIEEFFKLRLCINSDINMIGVNGEVLEMNFYGTVVNTWFKERKRLYKERIERQLILKRLYIQYLENIIRFSKERDDLKITNKTPIDKFNEILDKNKYTKFNKTLLLNPKYLPADKLKNAILESEDSNYNYIVDLTYRSMLKEACAKRDEELLKEKDELQALIDDCDESEGHFIGQKTWLRELDEAEKIINKGLANGWNDKKSKAKFKN